MALETSDKGGTFKYLRFGKYSETRLYNEFL